MSTILQETTKERRTPSTHGSDAGKMIFQPTLISCVLGGSLFAGIAGAGGSGFLFVLYMGFFGVGFVGFLTFVVLIVMFDRTPHVKIDTTTPVVFEEDAKPNHQPIRGNVAVSVPTRDKPIVEFKGKRHEFTSEQLRLMLDRVELGNMVLARALGFSSGEYDTLLDIMGGLDYWLIRVTKTREGGEKRSATWKDEGIDWLMSNTRGIE